MKKALFLAAMISAAISVVSCGSSKKVPSQTASDSPTKILEIQEWVNQAEKGQLRAFGTAIATKLDEQSAYSEALRNARFEIASAIQSEFDATFVDYTKQYIQTGTSLDENGNPVVQAARDKDASKESETVSSIKGLVQGAIARKSVRVEQKGAVTYYVGIETNIDDIVKYLSKSEGVTKLISQKDKDKIDENRAKFEELYRNRLESKK